MAIEDDKTYGLTGEQIKDLAAKVKAGGIKEVTGTSSEPVQMWTLEPGLYHGVPAGDGYFNIQFFNSSVPTGFSGGLYFIITKGYAHVSMTYAYGNGSLVNVVATESGDKIVDVTNGTHINRDHVADNLTTNAANYALSAKQGYILNEKIGGALTNLTTSDKTSLINAINEIAGKEANMPSGWCDLSPTTVTLSGTATTLIVSGTVTIPNDGSRWYRMNLVSLGRVTVTGGAVRLFIGSNDKLHAMYLPEGYDAGVTLTSYLTSTAGPSVPVEIYAVNESSASPATIKIENATATVLKLSL